ncbi:MAG: glycosyltransferase [Myxococcota bacterium]|nr:glycosyltransferase [Myxococcota bacterium]
MTRRAIVSVAYPFAAVGPAAVGGAEQVVSMIDSALVAEGFHSVLIAAAGSECAGELVAVPAAATERATERETRGRVALLTDDLRRAVHTQLPAIIEKVAMQYRADVIHMHGVDFAAYLPGGSIPVLCTLHLPLTFYPRHALAPTRDRTFVHGVSVTQMQGLPATDRSLPPIANGVCLDWYTPALGPRRRYVLSIGRICPEKGFHLAMDAARRARAPMLLAGMVFRYEEHERYFREAIVPRLSRGARFVGPVARNRKRSLLRRARALLIPSQVPETSSLVAMEAMACGTPVIAFRAGALVDIIEHGRTGWLVDDVDGMARAIREVGAIDPRACRQAAERRFSASTMTARYIDVYRRLAPSPRSKQAPCSP